MSFMSKRESIQNQNDEDKVKELQLSAVKGLFDRLEASANPSDTEIPDLLYGDCFLFCDPEKVNAIQKDDFLKYLPKMSEYYKSIGFVSKTIKSFDAEYLDNRYILVKISWEMIFENETNKMSEDIAATYILSNINNEPKIILQLDHQNLQEIINNNGIMGC